jgi:hypothetical protein
LFHLGVKPEAISTTTTTTTSTTTSPLTTSSEEIVDEDSSLEETDIEPDEFLPTFASFSQIGPDVAKPEPIRFRSPKFVPQPVRTVPIPISSHGLAQPILLNNRNRNEQKTSLEYGN